MTIQAIHELFLSCNQVTTDTRKILNDSMFFALKGENFNGNKFANKALEQGAKYAIVDDADYNSKDLNTILVDDVLTTLQNLATYHRIHLGTKIIALTGSNGKTTTKELINAVLSKTYKTTSTKGNLNNHIGVPLTLLSMNKYTEFGVVEMGANHQKEIESLCNIALPDYGYITNFGKAHLEGFGGVEGVIKGKSEMYTHLIDRHKSIFVNTEDTIQVEKTVSANTIKFGRSNNTNQISIKLLNSEPFVSVSFENTTINSQLIGEYNFSNISAAIAIGNHFEITTTDIKAAIENYTSNNNRSQILKKGSNSVILDAYNANPTSMEAALRNFNKQKTENKIVFLGDMFELGKDSKNEHEHIVRLTESMAFSRNYFIGENFYNAKNNSEKSIFFKSFEDLKTKFKSLDISDSLILIKGSRGMVLERILDLMD